MGSESEKLDELVHAICLNESNAETAKWLHSGNIFDQDYMPSRGIFEYDTADEDSELLSTMSYLGLENDPRLFELFHKYTEPVKSLVFGMTNLLEIDDDLIDWEDIEGYQIAMRNLGFSRNAINRFREDAGMDFSGVLGFKEIVSDLRSYVLVLLKLLPEDKVMEILDTAFNLSFAQELIDNDRKIPSKLLFKLSKERRASLSKIDPSIPYVLTYFATVNTVRDETTQLIESDAHPKFVEKLTPLIPDKVQARFEENDASMAATLTRFLEDFDPDNYSAILRAIIGSKYKVA